MSRPPQRTSAYCTGGTVGVDKQSYVDFMEVVPLKLTSSISYLVPNAVLCSCSGN